MWFSSVAIVVVDKSKKFPAVPETAVYVPWTPPLPSTIANSVVYPYLT